MCWTPLSNYPQSNLCRSRVFIYIYTYMSLGCLMGSIILVENCHVFQKYLQWINDCFLIRGSRYYWDIPMHVQLLNMLINTVYPQARKNRKLQLPLVISSNPTRIYSGASSEFSGASGQSPLDVASSVRHDHPGKNPYSHSVFPSIASIVSIYSHSIIHSIP